MTGELKMYAEMHVKNLHVMYPLFLKTLNNVGIYQQILINVSNIEFYENVLSSSTFLICWHGEADRLVFVTFTGFYELVATFIL